MRGRWNGGYIGPQQTPTAAGVRGIFNAAEMQQLSGASLWPQPANDPYFQYVTALLQGNGGPPTSASSTNTINFNADSSTNNFLLALNGEVRNDEFHPYQAGYYSNFFNGSTDYFTVPDNAAFTMGTGDFTIEGWFNTTASGLQYIIGQCDSGATAASQSWRVFIDSSNKLRGYVQSGGSSFEPIGTTTIQTNVWYHFAFVRNSTILRLYLNGVQEATSTISASSVNDSSTVVGIAQLGAFTSNRYSGYLSNIRVLKGTCLYANGTTFTPPTSPLTAIANTSLLTCQSNRFIDNSVNNLTATLAGTPSVQYFQPFGQAALSAASFTNNQPSPGTNGYYGVYFDGTGDYLQMAANVAFQYGTGDYTVEAWVYMTAVNANSSNIFAQSASGHAYFTLAVSPDGTTVRHYVNASGFATFYSSPSTFTLNTWYHVAAVRSGGTVTVYLNGVGGSSGSNNTNLNNSTYTPRIGSEVQATIETFTGYISNLRLVKGTALYTSNFTPSTTPLTAIANTSLLTCQSSSIIDNSGNNLTITTAGNAAVTVAQPFTSTVAGSTVFTYGSAYFDGSGDFLSATANNSFAYGSGDFTVEAWIYPTKYTASIIDNRTGGSATGLFLGLVAGGNVQVYSNVQVLLSPGTVPLNTWTHIALSRFSNTMYLYINGVAVTSGSNSTNYTDNNLRIGEQGGGGQPWGGYISNIRLVKGQAIYNGANFIPPNMPVTAVSSTQLLSLQYNGAVMNSGFEDGGPFDFLITRNGNVSQGTFTPYGSNWSNYLDGTGDYLRRSGAGVLTANGDTTIECWINPASTSVVGLFDAGPGETSILRNFPANKICKQAEEGTGATFTVTAGVWQHFACTFSNGNIKVYINGVLNGSGTYAGPTYSGGSNFDIGAINAGSNGNFTGYISNFRVTNSLVYTTNFTPPTAPLTAIANTSLLTCQSNRFIDNSTNNATITRNGDTSIQRFSPFRPTVAYNTATYSGSAYFDGTGDYLTLPVNQSALALGSSDFTFEAWVYRTSGTGTAAILAGQSDLTTAGGSSYVFYVSSTATTDLYVGGTGYGVTSPNPALGQWAHVAYARTGGTFSSYLNGVRVGTRSDLGSSSVNVGNQANPAAIGGFSNASSLLTGYITDARLIKGSGGYNATLGTLTVPAAPLASTTNTSLLLSMANTGQYDNAMMVNWESAGNTQSTPSFYKYGTGSLYFDGTGDYLSSTRVPAVGSGDFTIECWAYITGSVSNTGIWQFATSLWPGSITGLAVSALGASGWQIYYAGLVTQGGTAPAANTWYHLALVRSGTNLRLYVNGTSVISATDSTNYTGQALSIGGYYTTGYLMTGYIDDFRITQGIARYTSNFTPPTSQFVNS